MAPTERKRIRLPESVYREIGRIFSVTIGTKPRAAVFDDVSFGLDCIRRLREVRERPGARIYAYCLMPDHVHLLVGVGARTSLLDVMRTWKSLCYREWRKRGQEKPFWQRSFFDRALRREENIVETALYILGNPVRRGLAKDFHDYLLCGSMEFVV